jgi:hypothetical protein
MENLDQSSSKEDEEETLFDANDVLGDSET